MTPHQILKQYFGYPDFRPGQLDIVSSIIAGHDTLAILPTGGGKSICFQVPGLAFSGITIVISPLISLMKDQVDALNRKNVPATYLNSSLSELEMAERTQNITQNQYKFVYVAPERLQSSTFIELCQKIKISLLAIDEAHCISQWGHDFRPEYRQINDFLAQLPSRPVVAAFTATATRTVQRDIMLSLDLKKPKHFQKSFFRENLSFYTLLCYTLQQKDYYLFRLLLKHQGESGVIYTSTRKMATQVAQLVNHFYPQVQAQTYHGGLTTEERTNIQEAFIKDSTKIIVATNAFGMGIDKPNVRFVIHYQIPGNLENYYQEAGRAGRDQEPADCYLLYYPEDVKIQTALVSKSGAKLKEVQRQKLQAQIQYALTTQCKSQYILSYFDEHSSERCYQCSSCGKKIFADQPATKYSQAVADLATQHHLKDAAIATEHQRYLLDLYQPKTETDYLKIPGIGYGWINQWYRPLQRMVQYTHVQPTIDHPGISPPIQRD